MDVLCISIMIHRPQCFYTCDHSTDPRATDTNPTRHQAVSVRFLTCKHSLIYHEDEIAKYAHRIVRLKDGEIESDTINKSPINS